MTNKFIITLFCILLSFSALAQEKKEDEKKATTKEQSLDNIEVLALVPQDTTAVKRELDPLRPSKAAFYSSVLPGLGQAYNKKYWKIPIVYAALGAGVYFYVDNNNAYNRARDAYKRRLAGFDDDEFQSRFTDDGLREAQKSLRRNKELSLLVTVGLYALNIIDANVDAHLMQYNVDENLSFKPHYKIDEINRKGTVGLTMNLKLD